MPPVGRLPSGRIRRRRHLGGSDGHDNDHQRRGTRDAGEGRTYGTYVGVLAAVMSAAAGAVHLGYAPHHLSEDWAHGWFFVLVGAAQIAFARAGGGPPPPVAVASRAGRSTR